MTHPQPTLSLLTACSLACGFALATPASAADIHPILPEQLDGVEPGKLLRAWLVEQAQAHFQRRQADYEKLKTPAQITQWQHQRREFFIRQLGGIPDRTPLNPQVTGSEAFDGYRIEKIIYESRPRHYVTANLYLPPGDGPFPGVLMPCGHSANGKAAETYQRACILLVKHGFVVLCYDPIGQGERYQILDAKGKPRFGSTQEHTLVGVGAIPAGLNAASYRVWDGIRSMDYLASRPEVDATRLGCTGNSGGGTLTSYLMALDDRIVCAAPSCYLTGFPALFDTIGPGDAEQDIAGQIAFGMDHADYLIMRAPRPTLMCTATRDFFDIGGAWNTFRQAKRIYTRLDRAEAVDLIETDEPHGFSTQLRVGAVRWMRRWLQGKLDPIDEPDFPIATDAQLQCTPDGQVLLLDGARSAFDFTRDRAQELARQRAPLWTADRRQSTLEQVRNLARIRPLSLLPEVHIRQVGQRERLDGHALQRLILQADGEMPLPAVLVWPGDGESPIGQAASETPAVLYLHDGGIAIDHLQSYLNHAPRAVVMAVELRGFGETAVAASRKGWEDTIGRDWQEAMMAYLIDRPLVGMRAEDTLQAVRALQRLVSLPPDRGIAVVAHGNTAPAVLHAAALESQLFAQVALHEAPVSYANLVETPVSKHQLVNVVHNALSVYDLPDLAALLGNRLSIVQPVDAAGQPLSTNQP